MPLTANSAPDWTPPVRGRTPKRAVHERASMRDARRRRARAPQARRERGVTQNAQRCGCHLRWGARWNEEGGHPFLDQKRHAADIGAHDRNSARQRFEYRDRHVVHRRRIEHEIRRTIKLRQLLVIEPSGEVHCVGNMQRLGESFEVASQRSRPRYRQARVRVSVANRCERAKRGGYVVNRLEVSRHDHMGRPGRARRGPEPIEIDDVGNDLSRYSPFGEHAFQKSGRNDDGTRAQQARPYPAGLALQEHVRLAPR